MTSTAIRYRRQFAGSYFGRADGYEFAIYTVDSGWQLRIRRLTTTAGVQHALGQPDLEMAHCSTLREAKGVAAAWLALGDDYQPSGNGGLSRITRAILDDHASSEK